MQFTEKERQSGFLSHSAALFIVFQIDFLSRLRFLIQVPRFFQMGRAGGRLPARNRGSYLLTAAAAGWRTLELHLHFGRVH